MELAVHPGVRILGVAGIDGEAFVERFPGGAGLGRQIVQMGPGRLRVDEIRGQR